VLDQLDLLAADGWDDAEERQFVEVQPGTFQSRIGGSDEDAPIINNAKSSGRLQVSFTFTILEGAARGRRQWKHFGLDADSRGWLRGALAKLGYAWPPADKLREELPNILQSLNNTYCEIKVTKGKLNPETGMQSNNVYINRALDPSELVEGDISEEEEVGGTIADETVVNAAPQPPARQRMLPQSTAAGGNGRAATPPPARPAAARGGATPAPARQTAPSRGKPAPAAPAAAEPATEAPVDAIVETNFDDKAITRPLKKQITDFCTAQGFDATQYNNTTDFLADTAERLGVGGTFDDPSSLLEAAQEAAKSPEDIPF
jgi:hypothetical protein